jgi:hypothetical protein
MGFAYIIPDWFFGLGIGLEVIFGFITLFIAITSRKIYKLSKERSILLFSNSFFLISASYLAWAAVNLLVFSNPIGGVRVITADEHSIKFLLGIYTHIFLFTLGLVTLAYTTLKIKRLRVYYLLAVLGLMIPAVAINQLITFRILSVFLLIVITYHFFNQWRDSKRKKTLWIFGAFAVILAGNVAFIFSSQYYNAFFIAHILEFIGYSILLWGFIHILKNKKLN